jgi:ribosomal protein S27AE
LGYEWVLIAVVLGFFTGLVGKTKGNSFFLWFVIGAIIPVFGLIAAFMTRSEAVEPERHCPRCGKVVKLYVQICPRCGEELYLPDPTSTWMPGRGGGD